MGTRLTLFFLSIENLDLSILNLVGIFFLGFFYDVVNAGYVFLPLLLVALIMPSRVYTKPWYIYVKYITFFAFTFLLLFNAVSEYFFWDEFKTRYNFIAVDYLVYTTEVIGNIQQSYPIGLIVTVLAMVSIGITYLAHNRVRESASEMTPLKLRMRYVLLAVCLPLFSFLWIDNRAHQFCTNPYVNELAGNGLYELFAAYRNNELSFDQFYKGMDPSTTSQKLRKLIQTKESEFIGNDPFSVKRMIKAEGTEQLLNVVMISVESFSADFMSAFGNDKQITPYLDSLAQHSLLFTNLYATGTRTVRGLEALSLAVPPTPGQSIVRRPNNEDLFTLGSVFESKGYNTQYIYGGYGYFDNMNYFYASNGYEVIDRTELSDDEIDYENIWGVADENLFSLALKELDEDNQKGRPFFAQIMTTSNHRPYTYPEGRIDIPPHTGRDGAVKYTDYAINQFLRKAQKRPWFENTLFVIVADHCASSAGKTDLPLTGYHIPMLWYSPSHIRAGTMDRLMSQIDIAPTILGELNFSYVSKFYGYDMAMLEPGRERVFISTYQKLGFVKDNVLTILSPQKKIEFQNLEGDSDSNAPVDSLETAAICWYQSASYAFQHGLMKE